MDNNELLISAVNEQRNSLTTDRLDMSYGEIMSMYEKDEIIISPAFQRLYRWNFEQRTRLMCPPKTAPVSKLVINWYTDFERMGKLWQGKTIRWSRSS